MTEAASAQPTTWLDILKVGVSGWVDSQQQKNFIVQDPRYNTQQGVAGQGQFGGLYAVTRNPIAWVAVAGVVLAVVLLARR
jgi:hypothetical protein